MTHFTNKDPLTPDMVFLTALICMAKQDFELGTNPMISAETTRLFLVNYVRGDKERYNELLELMLKLDDDMNEISHA